MAKCKLCCKAVSSVNSLGCCNLCSVPSGHNIYNCDGGCTNKVRFRIAADTLETGGHSETFRTTDVLTKFSELARAAGVAADPKSSGATPAIYSLCPECWTTTSSGWSGSNYGTAAGKCVSAGFYFNASRPDYIKGGEVWRDKVRSTAIHELMHWRSKAEKGLQDYSSNSNWDECVTDMLGREVYFRLSHDNYESGYGNLTQFCELAAETYLKNYTGPNLSNWKVKRLTDETKPLAIKVVLDKLYKTSGAIDNGKKASVKKELKNVIFKFFVTYHNKGPATMLAGAKDQSGSANFAMFISKFKPTGMPNLSFAPTTYTKTGSQRYPA